MPPGTCRLCNGRHAEVDCHQYCTPAERSQRVALLGRCPQCLDYRCSWLCSVTRCSRCDEPHHEALCPQLSAVPFPTSNPMPSTSYVSAVANRPTFGDFFDATVPQRGARDQPSKRKTLLPPPVPQKKPKIDAIVSQPQQSVQNNAPPPDVACAFCERTNHSSVDCRRSTTVDQRKSQLKQRLRCFRCFYRGHRTFDCCALLPPCPNCGKSDHNAALCTEPRQRKPVPAKARPSNAVTTAQPMRSGNDGIAPSSSAKLRPSVAVDANLSAVAVAPTSKAIVPAQLPSVPAASNDSVARDARCVFCDNDAHSSAECTHYRTVYERKSRLVLKARCYRCWRKGHTAYFCREQPITCAKCGRADHHIAVCEDALTKTTIPSKSSSGLPTATKSAGTEQRPASSSTPVALEVPAPTPSSAKGHAAKTGEVSATATKGSGTSSRPSPSTTLNGPSPTPSTAHGQDAKPADVKGTVSATTAMNATSTAENRPLNDSTASRRPVATSAAKPIEEQLSKDDKTYNGANRHEGLPSEIAVSCRPSCPVETGGEALAAAETVESGSASVTSLPANLSTSAESSSSVSNSVTTSDEAPTSVPPGNDHVVLPGSASDARLTPVENNRKATDEKSREEEAAAECHLSAVASDIESGPSPSLRAITQEVPASVTQEVEVARKPGPSNDALDGIVDGSETSCTAAKAASPIAPKPALASFEDNHLSYHSSIAEAPMKPKNTVTDFAEDHQETVQMPTTTSDVSDVASSRDGERECDPKACTELVEASSIIDNAEEASEESPTSPAKGATPRVVESTLNYAPVCTQPAGVPALPLQRKDVEASKLAEPTIPVQIEVDHGQSGGNNCAGCATTTTDTCDKMDDDHAVTVTPPGTDEQAPQLAEPGVAEQVPGPSGDKEFATFATSATDLWAKVDDEAVTPTPQENDEVASQIAEPAVLQASAAAGPPDDNDFAVCATPITGPCDKMDVVETEQNYQG
ncbi:hypothetical protein AAVH_12143 [Aphelenchoides avenae]|nr:hypothetical protein AAVH_12143 [Aphelenchus avenae]